MLKSVRILSGAILPKNIAPVFASVVLLAYPAQAQDATWNGALGFWDVGISWSPDNIQPTGIATFTGTTPNNAIEVNGPATIQTIQFAADAAAYTIIIGASVQFDITGTGIVNNSANTQTFQNNGGLIVFSNSASAGANTTYQGSGAIDFNNTSTAGSATINVVARFNDSSSAGNATINAGFNRSISFNDSSTAASATFTTSVNGFISFNDNSSAGVANFSINSNPGRLFFNGLSTAANAVINVGNDGEVQFRNNSTAANATINANFGGDVVFYNSSTAASATITIAAGALVSFADNSTAGTSTITSAGQLDIFNSASAGNANITNGNLMRFFDTSTAGNATIQNNATGAIDFFQASSAGDATFTNTGIIGFTGVSPSVIATASTAHFNNNAAGQIFFNAFSTAANATFTNSGLIAFGTNATAANANITNNAGGEIRFENTATAGDATILTNGLMRFIGASTAGNATFTHQSNGDLFFEDTSTAANATFSNNGEIFFRNTATAANATFTNLAALRFQGNSTAANATITNTGLLSFSDNATAGDATITNGLFLQFHDLATAGNAVVTNNGQMLFVDESTGGNVRIINNAAGIVNFSSTTGPLNDGNVTAGSIEGAGSFILGSTILTVGSRNLSTEVSGVISGVGGSLIKTGIGTLTLSGINTYTGATEVWQGGLVINGSVTSNTTIFSNATLGGDGTIFGNLTVQSNGVLAPGNSIGTMTINGNATFNSAVYVVEVTPANSDRTNVSGTAQINGGIVEVQSLSPSNAYAPTQTYTIINAAGGVTGQFTSVFDDLAFYNSSLTYDANNVYLTLTAAPASFTGFATTPNTLSVANALDAANGNTALIQAMQGFTNDQVRAALPLLSGEIFATMAGIFIDESRLFRSAILSRLRNTGFAGFSGPLGYLADENSTLAYAAPAQAQGPFRSLRPVNRGFEYWAQAFGSWAKYDSDGNAATARRATGGVVMGFDKALADDIRAGFSLGYSNTQARVADRASKADADTIHFAAYLNRLDGRWSHRTGAALAVHNIDSERTALGTQLNANYFALTSQIFGETAYAMTAGQIALEPFVNLALVHQYTGSFTETGGIPALTTGGFTNTMGFSTLGMRFATRYTLASGQMLIPRATIAWQHAFGDLAATAVLNFQNTGTGMTIAGTPLSRDMLLTEVGFDIRMSQTQTFSLFYAATLSSDANEQTVRGKYQRAF